jgi:hypothetical protein
MSGIKESQITANELKAMALNACDAAHRGATHAQSHLASLRLAIARGSQQATFAGLESELADALERAQAAMEITRKALAGGIPFRAKAEQLLAKASAIQVEIEIIGQKINAGLAGMGEAAQLEILAASLDSNRERLRIWDSERLVELQSRLELISTKAIAAVKSGRMDSELEFERKEIDAGLTQFREEVERRESLDRRRQDFLGAVQSVCEEQSWKCEVNRDSDPNAEISLRIDTHVYGDVLVRLPLEGPLMSFSELDYIEISGTDQAMACGHWTRVLEERLHPCGWGIKFQSAGNGEPPRKDKGQRPIPNTRPNTLSHGSGS